MDINTISLYTEVFMEMIKNHPELCPHRWESYGGYNQVIDGKTISVTRRRCYICGSIEETKKEI